MTDDDTARLNERWLDRQIAMGREVPWGPNAEKEITRLRVDEEMERRHFSAEIAESNRLKRVDAAARALVDNYFDGDGGYALEIEALRDAVRGHKRQETE